MILTHPDMRMLVQHIPLLLCWYRRINLTTATRKVTFLWHVEDDGTSECSQSYQLNPVNLSLMLSQVHVPRATKQTREERK